MPENQAEVQAELMAQAFGFYADNLVTRDYLDARLDARFAQQDAYLDKRLAEQETLIEKRFSEQDVRIDRRFAEVDARIDGLAAEMARGFISIQGQFRLTHALLALLSAAILVPTLARWFGG